jgi:hypothetical protein
MLTPTPSRAVSSGRPAATKDPKVISRITAASPTAMISAAPPPPPTSIALPPASTVSPAFLATSAAASISSRLSSVTPLAFTVYLTLAYAADPSLLTAPA